MEQQLSHEKQVQLDSGHQDLFWRFSSQHGLSVEINFLWHAQARGSIFVQSQCSGMLPQISCNAYPSLAFRRHSKLPESISRFTDLLRSIRTHHINCQLWLHRSIRDWKNKNKPRLPLFTHPVYWKPWTPPSPWLPVARVGSQCHLTKWIAHTSVWKCSCFW